MLQSMDTARVRPTIVAVDDADETDHDFVSALLSLAKTTRALFGIRLTEIGLHLGQDQLLQRLDPERPITVSALGEALNVRPSTVSKMVDRLASASLVKRSMHDGDARRTMISITPAGIEMQKKIRAVWKSVEKEVLRSMGRSPRAVAKELRTLDRHLILRLRRLR